MVSALHFPPNMKLPRAYGHMLLTYDGLVVKVFLNGNQLALSTSGTAAAYLVSSDAPIMIGYGMVGLMGEATILKSARSPADNSKDRSCPAGAGGVPTEDILAHFSFSEGSGYACLTLLQITLRCCKVVC